MRELLQGSPVTLRRVSTLFGLYLRVLRVNYPGPRVRVTRLNLHYRPRRRVHHFNLECRRVGGTVISTRESTFVVFVYHNHYQNHFTNNYTLGLYTGSRSLDVSSIFLVESQVVVESRDV